MTGQNKKQKCKPSKPYKKQISENTQIKILQLELKKQQVVAQNLEKKIGRYEKANSIVKNTIAQQEIDDLKTELETARLQKEILSSKIESLKD